MELNLESHRKEIDSDLDMLKDLAKKILAAEELKLRKELAGHKDAEMNNEFERLEKQYKEEKVRIEEKLDAMYKHNEAEYDKSFDAWKELTDNKIRPLFNNAGFYQKDDYHEDEVHYNRSWIDGHKLIYNGETVSYSRPVSFNIMREVYLIKNFVNSSYDHDKKELELLSRDSSVREYLYTLTERDELLKQKHGPLNNIKLARLNKSLKKQELNKYVVRNYLHLKSQFESKTKAYKCAKKLLKENKDLIDKEEELVARQKNAKYEKSAIKLHQRYIYMMENKLKKILRNMQFDAENGKMSNKYELGIIVY